MAFLSFYKIGDSDAEFKYICSYTACKIIKLDWSLKMNWCNFVKVISGKSTKDCFFTWIQNLCLHDVSKSSYGMSIQHDENP